VTAPRPVDAPAPFQPGKPVGNIHYGACSWTDRTLIEAGTFYPPTARTAADRLSFYASVFPIVEVDATYYALPSERNAHLWVERTPPGFVFNIKAFGLFTHHPVPVERLPKAVKELLPQPVAEKTRIYPRDVPEEADTLIWEMQAQTLAPLAAAGKLGCMLFQFPPWFTARRDNIAYLHRLRERLQWPIAVEFRGGGWMTDNYRARTLSLLEKLGIAYVVVDEPLVNPAGRGSDQSARRRSLPRPERRDLREAEHQRGRAVPLPVHGGGVERRVGPVRNLTEQADRVHVLMNNCYGDYGVRNARRLAELLAGQA
jgi:uncharacterized protein YecE (DUF72 family)